MGALKGAPCTVKTTEVTEAGLKVIFEWQDESGTSHTTETIIPAGPQGQQGLPGTPGAQGEPGRGILTIEKTDTQGLIDTYTITYSDSTYTTFQIKNGENGGLSASGGTMTGPLILSGDPTLPNEAVTKNYVDAKLIALAKDAGFVYHSEIPQKTWSIAHNLGKYCSVTVVDDSKNVIYPDINYVNENEIQVSATSELTGYVFCN